jgi:hypothetical protein
MNQPQENETRVTDRKTFLVRLPAEMHKDLKTYAFFTGTSVNEVVVKLISEHLDGPGRQVIERALTDRAKAIYGDALDKLAEM